ncbi:MAG: hydroxyacid dehydrogenase [bacterium]|nr:hydroxyacid dehydrogenase [bacterium]
MARVLVAERIAPSALDLLREAGHDVDVRLGASPADLLEAVAGAQALIIRSATRVTTEVLEAGRDLVVVGRAGVGLDNVDLAAAARLGVTVVNAPLSNVLSAAEHTVALILAQARNIPQAHAALVAGRWERARWEGIELAGKTLGIVGLGQVGRLVAERTAAFEMLTVAHDPYVTVEQARELGIDLVDLPDLMARSDFVTVHAARTPETVGLIGAEMLAAAKPGVRIVNVARGGLVDEGALAEALRSGQAAGAALDVFDGEPIEESPLFGLPGVVVTPHLGASTTEAQQRAGVTIAEQVNAALGGRSEPSAP